MYHDYDMKKIIDHISNTPKKKLILDTSTHAEINDMFATTYALTMDCVDVIALSAAPTSCSPENGMEQSYSDLLRIRDLISPGVPCYRGATEYMKNKISPVKSDAAENIVRLVNEADDIVYIVAMGAYTNVACALLLDPSIANKAVVVLMASAKAEPMDGDSYNMAIDRSAAQVILECGIPVIVNPAIENGYIPFMMSNGETAYYLDRITNKIGKFLYQNMIDNNSTPIDENGVSRLKFRPVFDLTTLSLFRLAGKIETVKAVPAYSLDTKGAGVNLNSGRKMLYISYIQRDEVISDFFTTIDRASLN